MTSYQGGKKKIGKELARIICETSLQSDEIEIKGYCEPFCGMLGVYQHVPEYFSERKSFKYKAGDTNESVIAMWKAVKKGWRPPTRVISEEEYNKLKESKEASPLKGFVGHQYSFNSSYFKGYKPSYDTKFKTPKKVHQRINDIASKLPNNITFKHGPYTQFSKLKGYIIYCDPPYKDTNVNYEGEFNSDEFWNWCKNMSEHNLVFVSEYSAPKGIQVIWKNNAVIDNNGRINNKGIEKLYGLPVEHQNSKG